VDLVGLLLPQKLLKVMLLLALQLKPKFWLHNNLLIAHKTQNNVEVLVVVKVQPLNLVWNGFKSSVVRY